MLYEHRSRFVNTNPLAARIKSPGDRTEILFPLHPAARAYYDRESPGFWLKYSELLALLLTLLMLGISGLWQLFGNRSEGIIGMIALESLYEKVASPLLDLKLIVYTATVILQAKNSDSIFHIEKAGSVQVRTIIDSSSNLKVTLNMPDGIAKFIVENVEKHEGKYTVEIPSNWWYVSDTYDLAKKIKENPQIFNIDKKSKKSAS